ncbi:MAG: homoserine kinase [Streptosporangiaceae bacterium]
MNHHGFREGPVRVRVPATSANLGPGFDALGLAVTLYDEVEARVATSGRDVRVEGEGATTVDRGEGNLVVRAARGAFERLGGQPRGLDVSCVNRIPHGRGLGSSAAAIIAGILAARALVRDQTMDDHEVLGLAVALEGHPDNVAACLAGGLTVAWHADDGPRCARVQPAPGLSPVALVPDGELSTKQARGLLPASVSHTDAARTAGRAALLVAALTGRPELLLDATDDVLHQPYRARAMPETATLLARLRTAGVPAVISGAGPTILTLAEGDLADSLCSEVGTGRHVLRLGVDREGARARFPWDPPDTSP